MKLYKDGRCMQMVDKDQLDTCLEAGWSRTDKVAEAEALELAEDAKIQALEDARALLEAEEGSDDLGEGSDDLGEGKITASVSPASLVKTVKIKPLKNK